MEKFYVISREYVCNGITFNRTHWNIKDFEKANRVFYEELVKLKKENSDMLADNENYVTQKGNRKGNRYFECHYKYQPQLSNFSIEMHTEKIE